VENNTNFYDKSVYSEMHRYQEVLESQKKYFYAGHTRSIQKRKEVLKRLSTYLDAHTAELLQALQHDFGKSAFETIATELLMAQKEIRTTLSNLTSWSRPKRVKSSILNWPSKDYVYPEPYGICLIISPWNYPFLLAIQPLISAIAAGNCVLLKPSEHSPHTSRFIAQLAEACFDPRQVKVFEGDAQVSIDLQALAVDLVFFTGSTAVGQKVMQKASERLIPVVLELGGKSPCIVTSTATIKIAAQRIAWGKWVNAGQTCIAPDYVWIDRSIQHEFEEELKRTLIKMYGPNPFLSPDYARIIHKPALERLVPFLNNGNLIHGGQMDPDQRYIAPTILNEITWDMAVMKEEIFGPILPILSYEKLSSVIDQLQLRPKPLALYVFSSDPNEQKKLIETLSAGATVVNDTLIHAANRHLPFGGVGASGMGNYHGQYGFDTFSHRKAVVKRGTWMDPSLRYPPYDSKIRWLQWLLRK
jgi:aldehyde dehydrogenase (NAD+)